MKRAGFTFEPTEEEKKKQQAAQQAAMAIALNAAVARMKPIATHGNQ